MWKKMSLEDLDRRYDERYVGKYSQEHQALVQGYRELASGQSSLVKELSEVKKSAWRMERYLVGGLDEENNYTMGLSAWFKIWAVAFGILLTVVAPLLVVIISHQMYGGKV